MTVRVERIGDQYAILLTKQQIDSLSLREDAELTIESVNGKFEITPVAPAPIVTYASDEEAFAAYKRTEPKYAEVYRELAK